MAKPKTETFSGIVSGGEWVPGGDWFVTVKLRSRDGNRPLIRMGDDCSVTLPTE